jgi:DNA-binding transcriptional MerR regulator
MSIFPIGELSRLSRVKVPTIRYYETIGLLPEPKRTASNRRIYNLESLRQLNFIRRSREMGFHIEAIRQLQALLEDPDQPCENAHRIAEDRLHEIDEKITQLNALKSRLRAMVHDGCHTEVKTCALIEGLEHDKAEAAAS